jgi:hypothetical protein
MATTKSRINISLPEDVKAALVRLAARDQMPPATKAERLLEIGLELEEDQAWDQIAAKRDSKKARFLTHKQAFKV